MPGQLLVRFILLQKRLLQKGGFLLMLFLAPLLAAGVGRLSEEPAGIATIALYLPEGDAAAQEISERLLKDKGVLRYLPCEDGEQARRMAETGKRTRHGFFRRIFRNVLRSLRGGVGCAR